MAVTTLTDGAANMNAGSWLDGIGFAAGSTLIVPRGGQPIAGFDASAIAAGLYTRIERPFVGNIGTAATPLIISMTDGSIAQKKTTVVGAGGNSEGYFYYGAGSGSCYIKGYTAGIDNVLIDTPGLLGIVGGVMSFTNLAAGTVQVNGATTMTNTETHGGDMTLDPLTSGAAGTTLTMYDGVVKLNRAGGTIVLNGGTLFLDNDTATATTAITLNGGTLVLIAGDITTLTPNHGTFDATNVRKPVAIGTRNRGWVASNKGNFNGGLVTFTTDTLYPFARAV